MKKTVLLSYAAASFLFAVDARMVIEKVTVEGASADEAVRNSAVQSSDTATMLSATPGVSFNGGGGISSLPAIHGMADDRVKTDIDGMQITSACPNHMNPALSYIDPSKISSVEAVAGITPVSQGGDSIGGTIKVKSKEPKFSKDSATLQTSLEASSFYKSNNQNRGISGMANVATDKLSLSLSGMAEKADDYHDGHGDKVKGTLFQQQNEAARVAYKTENGVLQLSAGHQKVPYEGFVNQYMDMLNNDATHENLSYKGKLGAVFVDANVYRQQTSHYMNKLLNERGGNGNMPMNTKANEVGYNLAVGIPVASQSVLKLGSSLDKYTLDDWWPADTVNKMAGMSPGTFININDGHRDRLGLFAEIATQHSDSLSTNLGIRTDIVNMKVGVVHGYNGYAGFMGMSNNDPVDASAFNTQNRSKKDNNYDFTASAKYKNGTTNDLELGFARKTRSPNLYERYSWAGGYGGDVAAMASSPIRMDMAMVNWFGDANGYVGNVSLKPEVAYTLSGTAAFHDEAGAKWNVKITPYYTVVKDYIDVDYLGKATSGSFTNIQLLRFANHDAALFGADISANASLWDSIKLGRGELKTVVSYARGYRTDGSGSLYHIMPLNAKVSLEHSFGQWTNGIDLQAVASKSSVDANRKEPTTPAYILIDLHSSYKLAKHTSIDLAVTNLFDKAYAMPLGGIDVVNHAASQYVSVQGVGRSFNAALNVKF